MRVRQNLFWVLSFYHWAWVSRAGTIIQPLSTFIYRFSVTAATTLSLHLSIGFISAYLFSPTKVK